MSDSIPIEDQTKTQQLIAQLAWTTRPTSSGDNLAVETCPLCGHSNYKFFIHVGGDKDGLWDCKVCSQSGNFFQLRERLGIRTAGMASVREVCQGAPSPLPNADTLNNRLMTQEAYGDALDYLVHGRGFSLKTVTRLKIGAETYDGMVWIVYPYLDAAGKCIYFKARTVPPDKKAFRAPAGREAMLYNDTALRPGLDELVMVEGEADCIALINAGFESVVGIPGAGIKKAAWLDKLDRIAPKQIYLLYDSDKVGQDAARDMAQRIGIDKVRNIVLPEFVTVDGKPGKDINEYLRSGKTLGDLEALKSDSKPFDVEGVQSVSEVLDELLTELEENGNEPSYLTPWASLTKRLGGAEDGDVIGLMAEGKVGKTTMGLDWCQWMADNTIPSMLYCLEMLPVRLVRKWVSHVTQTDDTPGASGLTPAVVNTATVIASQMPADLLFGYSKSRKPDEVCNTIRQAVRRYGIKFVCLDNLQLLIHGIKETAQETSKVMKQLKALAMELHIVILLIIQPNRVAEGQIIGARNALGSSAIEKDVDAMICLHRNRVAQIKANDFHGFLETDETFEPAMWVKVDLGRYSAGGSCTLMMDGAKSTIRELTAADTCGAAQTPAGVIGVEEQQI